MATGAEARFSIPIEVDGADEAQEAANALEELRTKIQGSTERLRELSSANSRLKGTTVEVTRAKAELAAKIRAERDAVSSAQLKLVQMGTSYEQLASKTKNAAAKQKELADKLKATQLDEAKRKSSSLGAAMRLAGGPAQSLRDRLGALNDIAGPSGMSTAMNVAALGVMGLVAAAAALVAAAGAAAVSLGRWILASGNAARTSGLLREAWAGSASNAAAMGTQIDALADKVPTAKDQLNQLSIVLMKNGLQGQTLVDTFNAVGQAASALGDEAAGKLQELVTRGRLTQRFAVNPLELQGSGLAFDDIAKSLAKNMGVGVDKARAALFEGRVKLSDGAKALRDAVENRFAGLNLRKMFDLNVIADKAREKLAKLASGVNLDPLIRGIGTLADLFDEDKFTGVAIKELVTLFGTALVKAIEFGAPIAKQFFKGLVISTLQVTIGLLKLRNWLRDTFGAKTKQDLDLVNLGLKVGKFAVYGIAANVALAASGVALLGAALYGVAAPFIQLYKIATASVDIIRTLDWKGVGIAIVEGIVSGLTGGTGMLVSSVKGLADKIKGTFTSKLEIHSPSKVGERLGAAFPDGVVAGVNDRAPAVAKALDDMATPPKAVGAGGGRAGGGGPVTVNLTINAQGASKEAVAEITDDAFLQKLVKHLSDALATMGAAPAEVT